MTFEPPPDGRLVRHGIGGVTRIHPSIEASSDGRVDETTRASGHDDVSATNLSLRPSSLPYQRALLM